ncbi:proteophosphoglycan ppg4 [Rhodotorula toruloides]|uniref:Proteophosphoglycan ppg4 n=1 Tax=Rhodotorula toruloides TaxID=5286 RepID=A0A511KJG7_RHOTO|nr:proteophosphoglycan ppg4 [Rhodotorula toruloides]
MASPPAGKPMRPNSTRAASTAAAAALQAHAASAEPEPRAPKSPKKKTAVKPLEQEEQDWAREMLRKKMAALVGGSATPVPAPAPAPAVAPKPAKEDYNASKEKAGKEQKDEGKKEQAEGKKEKSKKKKLVAARTVDVELINDDDEPPKKKAKRTGKEKEKAVEPDAPAAIPAKKAASSVTVVVPAKSTTKPPPATPARAPTPAQTCSPVNESESKKARRKQKKAEKAAPAAEPEADASQAQSDVDLAEKERKRKERKDKKKAKKAQDKKRKEAEESQQVEQAEPPAKKKDKGKEKAVEAPPPALRTKKAAAPTAATSKKRKRAESPAPSEAGPSRNAPAANNAKANNVTTDLKHKKRKVDGAATVATQTTTEVILHAASPAARAAAQTASPLGPILPMALAPFMMPHVYDEQQNKALVEHIVQNFVNAGYGEQVDKVMRGVKRSRIGEEQPVPVAPVTDANAVAGPSGTSTSARTPAQTTAKAAPAPAPASSPLRTVKPPPSSAPQPTLRQQHAADETPAVSTRSSSPAPSALDISLNGNGSDGVKKRRVRPSKAARKAMSQASQSQPNTDVEDGGSVRKAAAVKAAIEASKEVEPAVAQAVEETHVVPETMESESRQPSTQPDEDDQLNLTPRPPKLKADDAMDVDIQAIENEAIQKQMQKEPKQVEVEEQVESDEELDELDSTPAQSLTHQQQRMNPAVSRVVESDSRAVTPSSSEDDDEEVQLSLKAHASPASTKKKTGDLPIEPEEAPLPPAAQTPSRNAQEEKEDVQKLSHAANTRLPSSSPEPTLPTIGGKRNDEDSDQSASSSSDDEYDESSDDEAGDSSSLLTRNVAHPRNGGGGRPSLSVLAKGVFDKPKKRGSLLGGANGANKVLASSALGYAGSPLKHSHLNAASSSPSRAEVNSDARGNDDEEIDQLLSQTQPSQRPKRTSDAYWAQLEREEEEEKKRKGKGKQDETSEDEEDEDEVAVDGDTATLASTAHAAADVAEPDAAAAVNGAPATGEPVSANASATAPRPSANDAGAPPITTAVGTGAGPSSPRRRVSPSPQPLPSGPAAASTSFLSPTQASQRPPDRIYPDLSSIGNLPTSSQAGSPPIEVDDPSQVFSGEDRPFVDDDDEEEEEEAQRAPPESQFVQLQKDKPLFLETQTQSFSQDTAGAEATQELAAEVELNGADEAEAPANDEAEEADEEFGADVPAVKVNATTRAPPTPDSSKETSPAPPAIVEPDQAEDERMAQEGEDDEASDGPTPKAAFPAKEPGGLAVPPTTPARITRASSARLASRSPSAEPPQAASQPVSGTPASHRRTYVDRKPEPTATSAPSSAHMPRAATSASQPTASTPSAFASGSRASRMLSLSQLDTVKQPTRRSTRASLAASASQPTTSQRSFIARDDEDDEDDEDDDAASSDDEADAGKGKGKARRTRTSMSQPVPPPQANGRGRRSKRQSDLWR